MKEHKIIIVDDPIQKFFWQCLKYLAPILLVFGILIFFGWSAYA